MSLALCILMFMCCGCASVGNIVQLMVRLQLCCTCLHNIMYDGNAIKD